MLSGQALGHQIVLPSQRAIYDYWRSLCREGRLPSRSDIDPADICAHLPMVSLTSVCRKTPKPRFQCRLVGTGFWDLYEDEITGRYVDELPLGDRKAYWQRVLGQVAKSGRPTAGVTRPGTPYGGHLAQFWIRMPLSSTGRDVDMIFGFDQLIKLSDLPKYAQNPERAYA